MALLTVTDPVVVVTGAGSGIGAATAILLARRGARVVLAGRREDALRTVAQECRRTSPALVVPTDVTDPAAVAALGEAAAAHFGRIDAWVNNAGVAGYGRFAELPADEFARIVDVNLLGVAHGMRTALLHLRRAGRGVVVNVASLLAEVPAPYQSAYTAAKYGVRGLSASVRQELRLAGERDIAVCTVLPASIDTPLFRHAANHTGRAPRPVPPVYPATVAAQAVLRALKHPRREIHAGAAAALTARLARLAPALTERVAGRLAARGALRHAPAPVGPGNLFAESDDDARIPGGHHGLARRAFRTSTAVGLAAGTAAVVMRRALAGRTGD
ncbi:short-chain dehydrogenase [Pilimelia terevasa]|uniref:Short-chain dehydrogenase n=1 Tax=Pilimelia terevasa TaxID=53372 RepID=A0A8J3FFA5_9ACTN|nr:SDR family oxidoreductase [Pilimelia terevasa]GGK17341.1 short-chain dehydrogenase [Pilimelia terevasa]